MQEKQYQKNNGYTLVETLIAIAILSFLTMMIFPSAQKVERKVRTQWDRAHENAATINLVKKISMDFAGFHWPFWAEGPVLSSTPDTCSLSFLSEQGHLVTYRIEQHDQSVLVTLNDEIMQFRFHTLESFSITFPAKDSVGYSLRLKTAYQDIQIPLYMGTNPVVIHE